MSNKPHIKLINSSINQDLIWRYKTRYIPSSDEEVIESKDYTQMAIRFRTKIAALHDDIKIKIQNRNLNISEHIDHIEIRFFDSFNLRDFGKVYLLSYGLEVVKLSEFNKCVLFAISDKILFDKFIEQLTNFIVWAEEGNLAVFDNRLKYIENFKLLNRESIINFSELNPVVRISLAESLYNYNRYNIITNELKTYLTSHQINFIHNEVDLTIETENLTNAEILEIVDNFDVILSVTSSLATVIGPSKYGTPVRSYGFTISNSMDQLPYVGIIDTGVDVKTPLSSIIEKGIDYTGTNALEDNVDHGTAVASLAALGSKPYYVGFRGEIEADAKIISLKVMDSNRFHLKDSTVINAIIKAKTEFPSIKIFVLTITYEVHKKYNEPHSDYAYQLDRVSHELGILIFISVGNSTASNDVNNYNLEYYELEKTNLRSPAESMNNISVGATADNLELGNFHGVAPIKEFPSLVTRSDYFRLSDYFTPKKCNKHIFNPDMILPGGDYEECTLGFAQGNSASMQVLSSNQTISFERQIGTSYSAPLGANIALKIQRLYPNLSAQSIKSLIINGCDYKIFETGNNSDDIQLKKIAGHGIPNEERILFSNKNSVTFIIERTIKHKEFIVIPIKMPKYLREIKKDRGLIKFTATLCFSFLPDKDNQLAYCPYFVAFSIFRNATPLEIKNNYSQRAKLRKSFSQDGYSISKPPLYSNVQKISFSISKSDIISEDGIFMLAVHSFISPHIRAGMPELRKRIGSPLNISIALKIEEILPAQKISNKLYDEIVEINQIQTIVDTSLDLEIEN